MASGDMIETSEVTVGSLDRKSDRTLVQVVESEKAQLNRVKPHDPMDRVARLARMDAVAENRLGLLTS